MSDLDKRLDQLLANLTITQLMDIVGYLVNNIDDFIKLRWGQMTDPEKEEMLNIFEEEEEKDGNDLFTDSEFRDIIHVATNEVVEELIDEFAGDIQKVIDKTTNGD